MNFSVFFTAVFPISLYSYSPLAFYGHPTYPAWLCGEDHNSYLTRLLWRWNEVLIKAVSSLPEYNNIVSSLKYISIIKTLKFHNHFRFDYIFYFFCNLAHGDLPLCVFWDVFVGNSLLWDFIWGNFWGLRLKDILRHVILGCISQEVIWDHF